MASTEKELSVPIRLVICVVIINSICHVNGAKTLFVNNRPDSTKFVTIPSQSSAPLSADSITGVELPSSFFRESTVNHKNGPWMAPETKHRAPRETSSQPLAPASAAGDSVVTLPANSTSAVSFNKLS